MFSTFNSDSLSPPGETIMDLLEERDWTQAEAATRLGVSAKHMNQVIRGHAPVSADLAVDLESVFRVPARFWLAREATYRAALAKQQRDETSPARSTWANKFPVSDMKRFGLIPNKVRDDELANEISKFLGIAPTVDLEEVAPVAFRKSQSFDSNPYSMAAWLRWGELEAGEILCKPFDADAFKSSLQEIRGLTALDASDWHPRFIELCAQAGVAVVLTPALNGVRANGAARWLSPKKALIQLSNRYKWEDIFWFSFFHEAGHLLLHRRKLVFIEPNKISEKESLDPEMRKLEHQADEFAASTLIPVEFESLLAKTTLSDTAGIKSLASLIGVAPAIIVGRIQHDRGQYNRGNSLRRKLELRVSQPN